MKTIFILVEPAVPENVGAAARAIKTMGFSELRLVNPCDYLDTKARMLAHASNEILENAKVYKSLSEAIADLDFTIATSARTRWIKVDIIPCSDLVKFIEEKEDSISNLGIIFGREESGLSNEELAMCNRVSTIPLASPYPSINLAQTVMIYTYTLSKLHQKVADKLKETTNPDSFKSLQQKINSILSIANITPDMLIYGRIQERLTDMNANDIRLLHSVTSKLLESLEKEK